MKEQGYLSVAEVAEEFGVTPTAVRNWISNGMKYKVEKVLGRKPRKIVKRVDVEDFLSLGIWKKEG